MKHITLSIAFLIFLLSFTTVQGLYQEKHTVSSYGIVASPASNARASETIFNGIWTWKTYINADMLSNLVSHQIFNVFVSVGYPNWDDDSRLATIDPETGQPIVPEYELGIKITPAEVASLNQLLASVDSRLKLWAWFGTYSNDPRATTHSEKHYYARVDLSTQYYRSLIIENIVEVASWGFYGVQDDTEDVVEITSSAQKFQNQIDFWNEEQVALNNIGVKLATFTYAGPPSLWTYKPEYNFVGQLNVDYIILTADQRQSQEVIDIYGPIETIWKTEIATGLSVAQSPCLINVPSAFGSGVSSQPLNVLLEWLSEINPTSYPNYVGHTIYCYKDGIEDITSTEWAAWDNYLSTLGEEGK